jgi:phosphatidylglycerol---prolipoprotein diacylglyceryl transferase
MYPVLFRIGGLTITSFGAMMALSFLVGGWLASRELRRAGHDPEIAWDLVLYAALSGVLGSKLYYLVLNWSDTAADPVGALTSRSGLVWYGGFILAAAVVAWRVRRWGLSVLHAGDLVAPALAVGYAIGRLGCFLVGDDYGRPTAVPWAVAFPRGAPPSTAENLRGLFGIPIPAGIPGDTVLTVHPTQLYEVAMALLIFALLWRLRRAPRPAGTLFALYLALAGVERFIVEIFRAKDDRFIGPLTVAQLLSLALVGAGLLLLARLHRPGRGTQVATTGAG